jgi:hypothetical protein
MKQKKTTTTLRSNKMSTVLSTISKYSKEVKSVGIAISGGIVAVVAIYFTVVDQLAAIEKRAVDREISLLTDLTVDAIKNEIDPLSKSYFNEVRRLDSIERMHAELIALDFMNKQDSLTIVLKQHAIHLRNITQSIAKLEMQADARARDPPDQLKLIWDYLQKKEAQDSTEFQINSIMKAIKQQNVDRLKSIHKGDRIFP